MKKLLLIFAIFGISTAAWADMADVTIGLYADMAGTDCDADLGVYVPLDVYVLALNGGAVADSLTVAEFKIDNWPGSPGYPTGQVTITWTSELTIGAIDEDFTIAWTTPQGGPIVHVGTLEFLAFNPAWITSNYGMGPTAGDNCGCLIIVDENFNEYDVAGQAFRFNCNEGDCSCLAVPTSETSWSSIKSLY